MTNYADYNNWLMDGQWIRVSARALIFSEDEKRILIEYVNGNDFHNFIGGGVEIGETLQACIARELAEETDAHIRKAKYLFLVENFFYYDSKPLHSLEHYFYVVLDRSLVVPTNRDARFEWVPLNELHLLDLRPSIVRDCLVDGTYTSVNHLILNET